MISEAHHENVFDSTRYEKRNNDYSAVPLCKVHHEQRHAVGFDVFWRMVGEYLGEEEKSKPPFFIAGAVVSLYITDFLDQVTSDLDGAERQQLLGEIADKINAIFAEEVTEFTAEDEAKLRKMLEILATTAHKHYTMRYRSEVN